VEGIQESLKNAILVLMAEKVIKETEEANPSDIWIITWDKIAKIFPKMKEELIPST
jgi:hypothetical protein